MEVSPSLLGAMLGVGLGIAHTIYIQGTSEGSGETRTDLLSRHIYYTVAGLAMGVVLDLTASRIESNQLPFIAAVALSYGVTNLVPTLYHFLRNRRN